MNRVWMKKWIVLSNEWLMQGSFEWLSNGQDVRNGGHYKTINRWSEPNYSDNKWENETDIVT